MQLAGQGKVPPHLHIPRLTEEQQRLSSSHDSRVHYKVIVVAGTRFGMYICPASGSTFNDTSTPKIYVDAKTGQEHQALCGPEYAENIEQVITTIRSKLTTRAEQARPIVLLHDRDPCHRCAAVHTACRKNNIINVYLPPRSPDLSPPDYGVFGAVKQKWCREVRRQGLLNKASWAQACQLFNDLLKKSNYIGAIEGLPARIEACLQQGGKHFEHRLCGGKRQRH